VLIPVSNVNVRDHTQWTALHWAAEEGHVDLIQMLLDADAFVDPVDNQGHTPLLLATSRGKVQAARLLIRGQASVSAKVQDGNTALHLAVGSGDIEMVDLLLSEGAVVDIATANKRGYTPKSLAKDEGNAEIFSRLDNPSKPKV
jgi:ankyrin repeat protein